MKPNIVIIIIDALRTKNLSLYGYEKTYDQNLKRITKDASVFDNCFTCANNTYTSVTSLFTAKYPPHHGILHTYPYTSSEQFEKLKKNKFWLPLYLSVKGYDSYFFSITKLWLKKGFNYVQDEKQKDAYRKINDKPLVKNVLKLLPDWSYIFLKRIIRRDPHKTDFPKPGEIVDQAILKLDSSKKPFFLFMHFEDVHYPWANTNTPKIGGNHSINKVLKKISTKEQKKYVKRRMFNSKTKTIEEVEAKYNKSIELVDREVGRFYDYLSENKLLDNTILIIMADHGFSISEHGIYLDHAGLYDETIHIPLIMKLPKVKPQRISNFVQNIDIAPTILDLLNEKPIMNIDGKSILPVINTGKKIRNKIFAFDGSTKDRWAVRNERKKLIFSKDRYCFPCKTELGQPIEEYDLIKDPKELQNIAPDNTPLQDFNPNFKLK